jgi:hypothetical protein
MIPDSDTFIPSGLNLAHKKWTPGCAEFNFSWESIRSLLAPRNQSYIYWMKKCQWVNLGKNGLTVLLLSYSIVIQKKELLANYSNHLPSMFLYTNFLEKSVCCPLRIAMHYYSLNWKQLINHKMPIQARFGN